jgi:hypothetical protein
MLRGGFSFSQKKARRCSGACNASRFAKTAQLARKLDVLEKKYDAQFKVVFDAIRPLMTPPEPKKRKIGFLARERAARYGRN